MFSNISKWGNSLGVRIPRSFAAQIGISEGIPIELIIEDEHILIRKKTYCLETLLAQVKSENLHHEIDTGLPRGHEVW